MAVDASALVDIAELIAVVFYGFVIIIIVRIRWLGPFRIYLLHFCFVNWILTLAGIADGYTRDFCKLRGITAMFTLTMGMDSLRRGQFELYLTAQRNFRLFSVDWQLHVRETLRMWAICIVFAMAPWNLYSESYTTPKCFLRVESAEIFETLFAVSWILFCFLRPLFLICQSIPTLVSKTLIQLKELHHERQLNPSHGLLLYKDHLRRSRIVSFSLACLVLTVTWTLSCIPMLYQIVLLLNGMNQILASSSVVDGVFYVLHSLLPLSTCLILCFTLIVYCLC